MINFTTKEGHVLKANEDEMKYSQLIMNCLDNCLDEDDEVDISLNIVDSKTLEKIIQYCKHRYENGQYEIEQPLTSSVMSEVVPEWYANFIDIDHKEIFDILNTAVYMLIDTLVDLCCAKISSMIRGKDPEEIRKIFNITDDFSLEEKKKFKLEELEDKLN